MIKGLGSLLVIAVAAAAIYGACNKKIDHGKLEKLIVSSLQKRLSDRGFPFKTIKASCPEGKEAKKGDSFPCSATVDGKKLEITATQMDDEGTVSWEVTKGLEEMAIGFGAEKLIVGYIENNFGIAGAEVTCPENIEVKKGNTFDCTATLEEVPIVATVTQQDDKANVVFNITKGAIGVDSLNVEIAKGLVKEKGVAVDVSCEGSVYLSKPGTVIKCRGKAPELGEGLIEARITDTNGGFEWKAVGPAE